jgi:hypothetical protein
METIVLMVLSWAMGIIVGYCSRAHYITRLEAENQRRLDEIDRLRTAEYRKKLAASYQGQS